VTGHSGRTHQLTFTETEVRKRFTSWDRGEADREWSCLSLLAEHAPGVAPRPVRRESDGGAPVVVMERVHGEPPDGIPMTPAQLAALGRALRRVRAVPAETVRSAGLPERINGPTTLPGRLGQWLHEDQDLGPCRDSGLVQEAVDVARGWLAAPRSLPMAELVSLGLADRKPGNTVWDGDSCRLLDFEDSGLSDPAFEAADQIEHIAGRMPGSLDPDALLDAVGMPRAERDRAHAFRPLWAAFWLVMLLPANKGFAINPPGTTEAQARHLLALLG